MNENRQQRIDPVIRDVPVLLERTSDPGAIEAFPNLFAFVF